MNGKTICITPHTFEKQYEDSYSCLLDGYNKSHDKIVEFGKDAVNEYSIYIKFGCNENIPNKTSTSNIIIQEKI